MDENSKQDLASMSIIANSGDGRSYAFRALEAAKKGDFIAAKQLLAQSDGSLNLAHKAQTELLVEEASGNRQDMNMLLVHSQDHLMTSMLANELIKEMVIMYSNQREGDQK